MINNFSRKPLNILKASLPFMPVQMKRMVSYYIKAGEFSMMCNNLDEGLDNTMSVCSNDSGVNNSLEMLEAIKPYLNENELRITDILLNTMKNTNDSSHAKQSFSDNQQKNNDRMEKNQSKNSGNMGNMNIDILKNMLNPEQKAMFDKCSAIINGQTTNM